MNRVVRWLYIIRKKRYKYCIAVIPLLIIFYQWQSVSIFEESCITSMERSQYPDDGSIPGIVLDDILEAYKNTNCKNRCPLIPNGLVGYSTPEFEISKIDMNYLKSRNISAGGYWKPASCTSYHKIAVIVPYRDRPQYMNLFLQHMHRILQKQMLDYRIFIVEQTFTSKFNRGMLLNIGFQIASETDDYDCYILHDIDLLPEDDRNMYVCSPVPRHMSAAIPQFKYKLPYYWNFGGVLSIKKELMIKINGYSNCFFAWGGEDDDFYNRVMKNVKNITRYPENLSRYSGPAHKQEKGNDQRFALRDNPQKRPNDGLTTMKYTMIKKELLPLSTRILVDINFEAIQKQFPNVKIYPFTAKEK